MITVITNILLKFRNIERILKRWNFAVFFLLDFFQIQIET